MHAVLGGHLDDSFTSQTHAFTASRLERHPLPLDSLVVATPREVLTSDVAHGIRCLAKSDDARCDARTYALSEEQLAPARRPIGHAILATPRRVQPSGFPCCALRAHGWQRRGSNPHPCGPSASPGHPVKPRRQRLVRFLSAARNALFNQRMFDSCAVRTHDLAELRLKLAPWITTPICRDNLWRISGGRSRAKGSCDVSLHFMLRLEANVASQAWSSADRFED